MIAWAGISSAPAREGCMKIPCVTRLPFIAAGLTFLLPAFTTIQYNNIVLVVTALVLGSKFSLTEISYMWLKEKSVGSLSYLFSQAKISTDELVRLHALQMLREYQIGTGYFIIDDTMEHHSKFCKWIHGVFVLFDHALGTNTKATCIVFLYLSDGALIKFPIAFRIYHKGKGKLMPWQRGKRNKCFTKYELAAEMLAWACDIGFPKCIVLADSWYCIEPFIKELRRLELGYVLEIKSDRNVKVAPAQPKLTPTGLLSKNQFDTISLPKFFETVSPSAACGFPARPAEGKSEKVIYHLKVATVQLTCAPGKHRVVESKDPVRGTAKYIITDQLTWEAVKIVSSYRHRWVIEEFFRNAKQLSDMEGVTIRSEQGVALALCLVSWIDSLLHLENHKRCTADGLPKEPLTVPSMIRKAQEENLHAFIDRVRDDSGFVTKWVEAYKSRTERKRKKHKDLVLLQESAGEPLKTAA